jgi:hypothetical protein
MTFSVLDASAVVITQLESLWLMIVAPPYASTQGPVGAGCGRQQLHRFIGRDIA